MTHYYAVIDNDLVTRDTNRQYSHVVAVRKNSSEPWAAYSWCGRQDLTRRKVQDAQKLGYETQVAETKTGSALFVKGIKEQLARKKVIASISAQEEQPQEPSEEPDKVQDKAKASLDFIDQEMAKTQKADEVAQEFQEQVTPAPDPEEITAAIQDTISQYETIAEFIDKLEPRAAGAYYRTACQRIINQLVRTALLNGYQIISPILNAQEGEHPSQGHEIEIQDTTPTAQEEARTEAAGPEESLPGDLGEDLTEEAVADLENGPQPSDVPADIYKDQTEHFRQIDERRKALQAAHEVEQEPHTQRLRAAQEQLDQNEKDALAITDPTPEQRQVKEYRDTMVRFSGYEPKKAKWQEVEAKQAWKMKNLAHGVARTTSVRDFIEALHAIKGPERQAYQQVLNSIFEAAQEAGYQVPAPEPKEG